jgi:hypothetical protein
MECPFSFIIVFDKPHQFPTQLSNILYGTKAWTSEKLGSSILNLNNEPDNKVATIIGALNKCDK